MERDDFAGESGDMPPPIWPRKEGMEDEVFNIAGRIAGADLSKRWQCHSQQLESTSIRTLPSCTP